MQVVILCGLLVHCSVSLNTAEHEAPITAIGLALLYPALMCLIMAMYSWRMNSWKLSGTIKSVLGVGCFLCLSWLVLFLILSVHKAEGVLLLLTFLSSMGFLALVMVWSSNDFHLPPRYLKVAVIASAAVILLALIIILILNKTWFQVRRARHSNTTH